MTTNERTVGRYLRWLLAALSLGAGVIHFAVSGEHYDVSWAHGTFFAVVAWLQLSWAIAVVLRPTRSLLRTGVFLNAGILGVWAVSRVWGVPIGPDAWTPESIALSDALSSACELGIVALALAVLVRPAVAQRTLRPAVAVPVVGIAGLGVAVVSSLAFTPALASSHHHSAGGTDTNTATASGHDHGAVVSGHQHGATTLNGQQVKGVKAADVTAESQADQPLDATTRATLKTQLTDARDFALRYPTVADAAAAGYRVAGGFAPGSGAHYITYGGLTGAGAFDPTKPLSLIYDGTNPASQVIGLMYYGMGESAPEGFAGPNDHWHRHSNVCLKNGPGGLDVPFPADQDVTAAQCADVQGNLLKTTGYMVHAWVVPSWESPLGVFSHDNPNVRCADGTFHTDKAGFCAGT
ncbi:MAG TPA: hypothetical protein VHY55_02490 [Acidimicrobiia bacterium]|jgi:hypothetical protein|nr:hypothetical protein [Acidimicrobiia bacterium]